MVPSTVNDNMWRGVSLSATVSVLMFSVLHIMYGSPRTIHRKNTKTFIL